MIVLSTNYVETVPSKSPPLFNEEGLEKPTTIVSMFTVTHSVFAPDIAQKKHSFYRPMSLLPPKNELYQVLIITEVYSPISTILVASHEGNFRP